MHFLFIVWLTLLVFSEAYAGLTFNSDRADITVAADAKEVTIPFAFENKTKHPITISRMDSACSCLYAKLKDKKMTYQPGEKGELELRFELGSFSGKVDKSLLLWTTEDKPDTPSTVLTAYITIPQLLLIEPVTTFWQIGEENSTKTVKLTVKDKTAINIEQISTTSPNFDYDLIVIRQGWQYEMKITPKDTSKAGFGIFRIKTDSPISRYQTMAVYGVVKK